MGYEEFVGVEQLKKEQRDQLAFFQKWAEESSWSRFHENHYDWWAFPIDRPSAKGFRYSISDEVRLELLEDSVFIEQLRECSRLLFLSWGWDVEAQKLVSRPSEAQTWAMSPVRLNKCNRSLKLFKQTDLVTSTQSYTRYLISQDIPLFYLGNDLTDEILGDDL
jgi:hypothetical protein